MRALLVGAGPLGFDLHRLAHEAASADLVVAVDGGAAHCLAAGLTVDVLIGDLDSIAADVLDSLDDTVQRVVFPAEKDETDLELAAAWCVRHGVTCIVAAAVTGGRLDHELAALGSLSRAAVGAVTVVDARQNVVFLCAASGWFEVPAGAEFSILSLSDTSTVTVTGARWSLHEALLESLSGRAVSNIASPSGARVRVTEGRSAVIVPRSS